MRYLVREPPFHMVPGVNESERDHEALVKAVRAGRFYPAYGINTPDHIISTSYREIDGEDRNKAVGTINGKLYTAVHVWRGETIRLISVRRSNAGEQRDYHSDPG